MAALKKMLPIGLNMCTPGDQELISLAKTRYLLVGVQMSARTVFTCEQTLKRHVWFMLIRKTQTKRSKITFSRTCIFGKR